MKKAEIWKPIDGYDMYKVSDSGRVKSYWKSREGRLMRLHKANEGYLYVELTTQFPKKKRRIAVHRLVATAFIPNPTDLPHVNHIDENKSNNHASNLEWCTPKHNNRIYVFNHPEKTPGSTAKLTNKEVKEIHELILKKELTISEIADKFEVSEETIFNIQSGKTWSKLTGIGCPSKYLHKLTKKEVLRIRELLPKLSNVEIAYRYHVNPKTISDIRWGRTWSAVTGINRDASGKS